MNPTRDRSYRALLWGLALLGAGLDQATKYGVFRWLYEQHRHPNSLVGQYDVIPGVFMLHAQFTGQSEAGDDLLSPVRPEALPQVNHGALFGLRLSEILTRFGLIRGPSEGWDNGVFALVSVAAGLAIAYWSTRPATARDGFLCAALGLILGGTIGNFYDRLVFHGVRDFLYFYWIEWPVFNVADCCLVCGAFLLLAQALWSRPRTADAPLPEPELGLRPEVAQAK
jgi:signal peptidase II